MASTNTPSLMYSLTNKLGIKNSDLKRQDQVFFLLFKSENVK